MSRRPHPLTSAVLGITALLSACAGQAGDLVEGTGTLEAIEIDVAATTGGRVERVLVDEGDRVAAGDTLAVLTIPTLAAERAQRTARVARLQPSRRAGTSRPRPSYIEICQRSPISPPARSRLNPRGSTAVASSPPPAWRAPVSSAPAP
ncbi:MAG: biotin/lipoyl-binding protein [Gemmatimonadota bacterium]